MMEVFLGKIAFTYLLLPLLAMLFAILFLAVAKKNKLLGNKKLIVFFLLSVLIMVFPALAGFVDYYFVPYIYAMSQVIYLVLGYCCLVSFQNFIPEMEKRGFAFEFLLIFLLMSICMALYALVFNLCSELPLGIWASTCMFPFLFISLFRKAYRAYLQIPLEIYSIWHCGKHTKEPDYMNINSSELMLVELELYKQENDPVPSYISAKAVESITFGDWFELCITDYNKEYPRSVIAYMDKEHPYGWIFYVKPSFFRRRVYINPYLSWKDNNVKSKCTIVAKRVQQEADNNQIINTQIEKENETENLTIS